MAKTPLNPLETALLAEIARDVLEYQAKRYSAAVQVIVAGRGGKGTIVPGPDGQPVFDDGKAEGATPKKRGRPKKALPVTETPAEEAR